MSEKCPSCSTALSDAGYCPKCEKWSAQLYREAYTAARAKIAELEAIVGRQTHAGDLAVWLLETDEMQGKINGEWRDWGDPPTILDMLHEAGFMDHNKRAAAIANTEGER